MRSGRPSTITPAQREEFWRRYKAGESVLGIIGALRQRPGNINRVLEASGGIAPVPRTRSQRVLRFGEREEDIATLVERQSRFVVLVKLSEKSTEAVVDALISAVRKLPIALRKSLTWDRGAELASHATFTVATDVKVYFCDPSSPWQRGSNENTNGLLRQYYPKGKDLSTVSQAQLDTVARKLNTRPRETLNWKTPAYILESSVSMTG